MFVYLFYDWNRGKLNCYPAQCVGLRVWKSIWAWKSELNAENYLFLGFIILILIYVCITQMIEIVLYAFVHACGVHFIFSLVFPVAVFYKHNFMIFIKKKIPVCLVFSLRQCLFNIFTLFGHVLLSFDYSLLPK